MSVRAKMFGSHLSSRRELCREVNGVPQPVETPLEKIDLQRMREIQAADPINQLQAKGLTQKEAMVEYLNSIKK